MLAPERPRKPASALGQLVERVRPLLAARRRPTTPQPSACAAAPSAPGAEPTRVTTPHGPLELSRLRASVETSEAEVRVYVLEGEVRRAAETEGKRVASVAAAMKNAAEEKSPGTSISPKR